MLVDKREVQYFLLLIYSKVKYSLCILFSGLKMERSLPMSWMRWSLCLRRIKIVCFSRDPRRLVEKLGDEEEDDLFYHLIGDENEDALFYNVIGDFMTI